MSYLIFEPLPQPETAKTKRWAVKVLTEHVPLAEIAWWVPWRRYAMRTTKPGVIFDATCLSEIATFIEQEMLARKQASLAQKQGHLASERSRKPK